MSINKYLFNIHIDNPYVPQPGMLLIAEPFLAEPYFNHAVILLVDGDSQNETMGIVLNIDSDNSLQSLIQGIEVEEPIKVYCGGPLGLDRLYFLHTLGNLIGNSAEIGNSGLYIGGDFDAVINYINSGYPLEGHLRFFVGYSGWSPGQLPDELSKHVWALAHPRDLIPSSEAACHPDAAASLLLTGEENAYWHRTIAAMGSRYRWWRLIPKDIRSN